MKSFIVFLGFVLASQSYAVQYDCLGTDKSANEPAEINLVNITADTLVVNGPDGEEHTFDRWMRKNEASLKYAVYGDDSYDGYGGYIKVSVPKSMISTTVKSTNPFTTYFEQDIYSEAGKVGQIRIEAICR